MSLNHILKDTVLDDECVSVKFDVVECNEIIFDNDISGNYYGSVSPSTIGENFGGDLVLPTSRANYCNRLGDAFNVGYSGTATMTSPNAVASFSITCPYPTKIRQLIASNNGIININNLFSTGSAHILTQTTAYKGHHFYVASSEPAPGLETTHIKINFVSFGRDIATAGGFSLEWIVSHHSAGNPPV
jgi:hypothetical protein